MPVSETRANLLFVTCFSNRKKLSSGLSVCRDRQIDVSYTNTGGKAAVGAEIILLVEIQRVETKIANDSVVAMCGLCDTVTSLLRCFKTN